MFRLLTINPGSTSTKIAVYDDTNPVFVEVLRHRKDELAPFETIYDQYEFRKQLILGILRQKGIELKTLDAVVGRGGLVKPVEGGTYTVNERILEDARIGIQGQHPCNLGGIIAYDIAKMINKPAFVVDPGVVDELDDIARYTGIPNIKRTSLFHALNQKAVARRYAAEKGTKYENLNLIIVHLGGGISVGCHKKGRVVDVNNALEGEGPFSPERAGSLPVGEVIKICYSGKYTFEEMKKYISSKCGFNAYFNTQDVREVEKMIDEGNEKAKIVYEAMAYQVAKWIGMLSVVLKGEVDAIILTGGIAYSERFVGLIKERVEFIAPIVIYPGEDEMLALAEGGLRVLNGEEKAKEYK